MSTLYYTYLDSPIGDFLVAGTDAHVHATAFSTGFQQREPHADWRRDEAPLRYALDPLRAYFDGEAVDFNVPLKLSGTPFQLEVWDALQSVGYGETASYGEIASRVGRPAASRAVGAANRANCVPILVPCHRIIGADGSLTGFGGGLDTKSRLLALEGAQGQISLF